MRSILVNALATIVVGISFIFNSYILALCCEFFHVIFVGVFYKGDAESSFYSFLGISLVIVAVFFILGIFDVLIPFMQLILRTREPLQEEKLKIKELLSEVLNKLVKPPEFDIKILIEDEAIPNASCYGRKTIIVTTGLLNTCTEDEIKALLLHAAIHLIRKEGLLIVGMFWLNLPLQAIMWLHRLYVGVSLYLSKMAKKNLFSIVILIPLVLFSPIIVLNLVGRLFLLLVFTLFRRLSEYAADEFVAKHGYRDSLIVFLHKFQAFANKNNSIVDILFANQPNCMNRIAKLEKIAESN